MNRIFYLVNRQTSTERETRFKNDECGVNEGNCEPPTVDEIRGAIAKLRNETPCEDL